MSRRPLVLRPPPPVPVTVAPVSALRPLPTVFLVSLVRTPERTAQGLENLEPLGLKVEVVPACDGASEEGNFYPRDPRTTHMMQPGEVGICMSFWKVCSRIVRDDLPWAIYAEDDIEIIREDGFLEALHQLPENFHFAHINDATKLEPEVQSEGPGPWLKVRHSSWVTVAYAISNAGARAALKSLPPFDRPVDVWLRDNLDNLNFYQMPKGQSWFGQSFWRMSTARQSGIDKKIPKKIHRIWLGDKPIPSEYEDYWESWQKFHPDHSFHTWRDFDGFTEIPEGLSPAAQSDILRLHILHKYGGLYVDTDFECCHSFVDLTQEAKLVVAEETGGILCNGLMGSTQGHPLMAEMLVKAVERTKAGMPILQAAGPGLVRLVVDPWRNHYWTFPLREKGRLIATRQGDTGIIIIDSRTLFPYLWTQLRPSTYGGAWGAHHWGRSWWTKAMWDEFYQKHPECLPAL